MSTPSAAVRGPAAGTVREITLAQAIREALAEEMRRDPRVFILGEDVAEAGTPFKVLSGLVAEFGPQRVLDTSGGKLRVPLVVRTTLGATRRSAAQHSQSLHAWFAHVPGLKVAVPSTPYDAKGLLKTAIRDDNPVLFFEDKMMYQVKGPVPEEEYTIPFGVADVKRPGRDVTLVATSSMVYVALEAAELLEQDGISAEVVDPRTIFPLDVETLVRSARKTGRVVVVDEGHRRYGVTAELAATIAEEAFYDLEAPVRRVGALDVPVPFSPVLEDQTVPTPQQVASVARELCGRN
jgi:pyruvate dehydrogenase E1 component beta subunit